MEYLNLGEATAADVLLQPEPDALHLWQLWHVCLLDILTEPAQAWVRNRRRRLGAASPLRVGRLPPRSGLP